MKPLNLNNKTACSQITSSNCVRWDGPDIECLDLCYGESVSEVVYKLGNELCTLLDTLNVSNYNEILQDCPALNECEPLDIGGLFEFILTNICQLQGTADETEENSATLETLSSRVNTFNFIQLATCFQYVNTQGDTVRFSSIEDYVRAIGERVCLLVAQIATINNILSDHSSRITALENAPEPELELPQITPSCIMTSIPTDIDVVLSELEQQFCELRGGVGTVTEIYENLIKQPSGLNEDTRLCSSSNMSTLTGWETDVTSISQSIGNLWLAIGDIRCAIKNIQENCCPTECSDIELGITATIESGTLKIYISGTIPTEFSECNPLGTVFTITDSLGNSITQTFRISDYINGSSYDISLSGTPLVDSSDMTISANPCLNNGTHTCESVLRYTLENLLDCPALSITPSYEQVTINFTNILENMVYSVELWSNDLGTMITNNIHNVPAPAAITSTFTGLTSNTNYKVRLTMTSTGGNTTYCTFNSFATLPEACTPPTGVSSSLIE